MEGEFKVKVVEFEEKSASEKEAELLEGLETHSDPDGVVKVDLSQDAPTIEPITEGNLDPVQELDLDDNKVLSYLGKRWNKEITSLDELAQERQQAEELPEDVSAFLKYKRETGRGIEDFMKLNVDYSSMDEDSLLYQYAKEQNPGLDPDEVKFELETKFSYDEDFDDDKQIKKVKLERKKELNKAREYFNSLKEQYKVPLESREAFVPQEEREAYESYKQYKQTATSEQEEQQKRSKYFADKTNELFSDKFEGFRFNIDENKAVTFKPADAKTLLNEQSSLSNFVNKFLNEEGYLKDAEVFHRAIAIASNPEKFAKFFYEKGMTEAVETVSKESKNIDMTRQATQMTKKTDGTFQVRAIEPSYGNRLVIKQKPKN
jgi:hypothetical protein